MTKKRIAHALAFLMSLCAVTGADGATVQVSELGQCRAEKQCRILSSSELGRLRGGYTFMSTGGPLELSFGIARVVYVNNEMVAITQLVLPEVMKSISGGTLSIAQIQSLNSVLTGETPLRPSATINASPTATAPAAATSGLSGRLVTGAGSAPAAAPSTVAPPVLVNSVPVAPGAPPVNVSGAAASAPLLIQNGTGNQSTASSTATASPAVVVQNTLSNQTIRAMTVFNISMNITSAINAANIQQAVRQAIASSVR
jgi:hypothetical protein